MSKHVLKTGPAFELAGSLGVIVQPGDEVEIGDAQPEWCASRKALREGRLVKVGPPAPAPPKR